MAAPCADPVQKQVPGDRTTQKGLTNRGPLQKAGPLSQWLYAGMKEAGLAVELLETRHVRDAFKAMPVKSDRNDARGIAQLMRLGWFRPVHCKSVGAQETRAVLTARKLLQKKLRDVEASLRGTLRGFGLKVGKTTSKRFAERVKELVVGHASLAAIAEALLAVHAVLLREFNGFERRVRTMARHHAKARLLMSTPGVGAIGALTFASALLFESAHVILTKAVKGSALKSWAMRLAKRAGMKKAKVALARKLAVIMHRMLVDGTTFDSAAAAA